MNRTLSTHSRPSQTPSLRISTAHVRLIHEDPPEKNGQYMQFGVQEAYLRTYAQLAPIEHMKAKGRKGKDFSEVIAFYFQRTHKFRRTLENELCAYWMTSNIIVARTEGEPSRVPVVTCTVLDRHRMLAFGLKPIVEDLDEQESKFMLNIGLIVMQLCPPLGGSTGERIEAEGLIDTVHEGLSEGFRISAYPVWSPYAGGN